MSLAMHCESCDSWARGSMTQGWLVVDWDGLVLHFCSWDCLLRHGARQEPVTVVDV